MSTSWSEKKRQARGLEELPKYFCGSCTALRAEDDPVCLDCGREQPGENGWTPTEHAYDPFLGRVLNERYLIDKIEGRGSSSTIYRADSLKVPKRFAVKMVKLRHTEVGGRNQHAKDGSQDGVIDQIRTRLEREVRAVGMLRNPHIVRVYELLELDQNWIALIMDHIDGYTLEQVVEHEGALPADRACGLLRQVANGLCEAHRVGMIHRDIKPANIMVELLPDGRDFAYLLDFGVVHLEGEAKMTQGFLGTPLYASPEQASATKLDARSDIYSLGATFFYILTGHAPFDSDRTLEVLRAHVYDTAPRLSDKCPEANYPPALEALVASMLAKSPEDRPDDLFEVIESLQRILDADTNARRRPARAQLPSDSADFAEPVGGEDSFGGARHTQLAGDTAARAGQTTSFEDRPRTATGLKHVSPDRPLENRPAGKRTSADQTVIPGGSPVVPETVAETSEHRARRDSSELTAFNHTNPHGFQRPPTSPGTDPASRDIEVRSTVQFLPEQLAETAKGATPHLEDGEEAAQASGSPFQGFRFARNIRACAAADETLVAFVDVHNEIWAIGETQLDPVCTPMERVTSLATTSEGIFVGLADGTINRLDPPSQGSLRSGGSELLALYRDPQGRAIVSLAAPTGAGKLLASTSDGTVYLGMLRRRRNRWVTLNASRPVATTAVSPRGAMFAVASTNGYIRASTTDAPTKAAAKFRVDAEVIDMSFSHDGHLLAVLLDDGRLPIFQVLYGRQISELPADDPRPHSLFFSRENILHGVCTTEGRICFKNLTLTKSPSGE